MTCSNITLSPFGETHCNLFDGNSWIFSVKSDQIINFIKTFFCSSNSSTSSFPCWYTVSINSVGIISTTTLFAMLVEAAETFLWKSMLISMYFDVKEFYSNTKTYPFDQHFCKIYVSNCFWMVKSQTRSSKPHRQATQVCPIVGGDVAVEPFCQYLVPKITHQK